MPVSRFAISENFNGSSARQERHPVFVQFGSELLTGLIVVSPDLKLFIMTYSDERLSFDVENPCVPDEVKHHAQYPDEGLSGNIG